MHDFFQDCGVQNVRIVEDKLEHKPKGFGYVEFTTLDGLKKALDKDGEQFQGRNIRLSVADPRMSYPFDIGLSLTNYTAKDRPEARELNDWTRKGPLPDLPGQNQQRRPSERGFSRGYEAAPNADTGSERGGERGGPRRQNTFNDDGKNRDFGNWERKGPLSPVPNSAGGPGGPMREGGRARTNDGPRERRLSPAWGEGTNRSQDGGSRPPRGELRERPPPVERVPTAADLDNQWRARMKPDAPQKSATPTPEPSAPTSPAQAAPPTTRPRLNLQKRTVSEAEPSPTTASGDSKASPFGAARPIDTATREREIEEKRQIAIRQRKEVETKEREERKAKAEKEKAERAAAGGDTIDEEGKDDSKENGDEKPGANYEILRRVNDDDDENGATEEEDGTGPDAPANGTIVDDKAVKPKEIVRDAPRQQGGGSWRRPSKQNNNANSPATPTADNLEEDGWSTVPAKERKGRGRGGARAVAS